MNICVATSVLAYGTKRFLSCDDLVIVVGAGGGMSSVGIGVARGGHGRAFALPSKPSSYLNCT